MAVTKRTRFEVLRRDGFTCRYCGAKPEQSELTIDHVTPVSLGGDDSPGNLVAACRDCNAGKASSNPDAELVADVASDALRWAAAMRSAQSAMVTTVKQRDAYVVRFLDRWCEYDKASNGLEGNWEATVRRWCDQGFPIEALLEGVDIAMSARGVPLYRVFRYLCGVVGKRLDLMVQDAQERFAVVG